MKRKITAKNQYTTYASHPLVAGDVRAYEIYLDLGENVEGAEFKVTAIRSDGNVIEDIGKIQKGIATYTMAANMYSVPGELIVRLAVLHDSSVLTDREIVFEVLEGTTATTSASTIVPINDSVVLRLGAIEQKLSEKVDKVSGMGLSANNFTDMYKQKLDDMDDTIGKEVEKISEDLDYLLYIFDKRKDEVELALSKKVNKSDITGVYTFGGSVDTLDDLEAAIEIRLMADGEPEYNGKICGTFNENTGVVVVNSIDDEDLSEIVIPVKEVELKAGYYAVVSDMEQGMYASGILIEGRELDAFCYPEKRVIKIENDAKITQAAIIRHSSSSFGGCKGDVVCTLIKVNEKLVKMDSYNPQGGYYTTEEYNSILPIVGMVYNVRDTDMNYAWTGTQWDALGGEHIDLEARDQIEANEVELGNLKNNLNEESERISSLVDQMSNMETALDSIIEIQNSLIGGDDV